ncbi:putative monodehydroascorbate reductase (NADH) [Helianthus debilis subsp. tardiflorus]
MAEEGIVVGCHNADQWKEHFNKHKASQNWLLWISLLHGAVDVNEVEGVAQEYSIEAMPTFLFFKKGVKVDTIVGAKKEDLLVCIAKNVGEAAATVSA